MKHDNHLEAVIERNLRHVKNRIQTACHKAGRNPDEVQLLLATKTVGIPAINLALSKGEKLIGENRALELKYKVEDLRGQPVDIHFIGHLQTNKIKIVLPNVDCIQSVDSIELAQKLNRQLKQSHRSMNILLQVNTSGEASKFGISPEKALQLADAVSGYESLKIKGLMTIGLFSADENKVRPCFRLLKDISTRIAELELPNTEMKILSMGMSNDLEIAIEEGSTMIRVGTAIFGNRNVPDSYYWNEES